MAPPKDIARSYPKRGLTADVGFRSEPKFCGDGSVYFDGSSNSARTATSLDLAVGDTFTLTTWLWLSPAPSGASLYALAVGDPSGSNTASIAVLGGPSRIYSWNGSTLMQTTIDCPTAKWLHVAVVIKPGAGNSQIFVDGVDLTSPHAVSFNVTSSSSSITIGDYFHTGANDWQGYLANACLFTESLTEDQVRQVMRASDYASHAAISTVEAFYPLSANFNDSTGSHNATLTGSVSFGVNRPQLPRGLDLARGAAQARVYTGRCVDFDGSADRLTAAHYNPSGDYLTTTAWVNVDTFKDQGLISNGSTGRNSFLFYMFTSGAGALNFYWNDTTGSARITHQTLLKTGQWYHLAAVMDMSDPADHQVTFYIDGIAATGTRTSSAFSGTNIYAIGDQGNLAQYFNGKIADCRIYDVELTQDQIRELYHNPEQVLPTGVSASNLRRYYPLSDYNDTGGTGGRYFQDMGADGEPAVDQGSANMAFAQPVPCPQLGLQQSATRLFMNGLSSNKATVTLPSAPGSSFSFQLWVNMKSVNSNYALEYGDPTVAGDALAVRIVSGTIGTYDTTARLSGLTISEGEWTHIVMATSDSSPYWRCWVNGSEASSPTALTGVRTGTSTSLTIGASPTFAQPTDGTISNCAFWTTQLDTPDVAALYNSGDQNVDVSTVQPSSLVGWWKCDDFTKFKNYANPGTADATVTGSPIGVSFPENASGSTIVGDFSMKRKGVSVLNAPGSGRATLAANASLLPTTGGGYTLCAFVRLQSTDNDAAVIMSTSTGVNEWGTFYEGSTNKYKIVLSDGTTNILDRAFSGTVTDSEWHHIAWTIQLDATTATGETYIDGAPDLSFTRSSFNTPPAPSEFAIGYDPGNADKQANAAIACLRIYQSVLSANEIKQVYSSDLRLIKGLANE